jgi:hypothetical protein
MGVAPVGKESVLGLLPVAHDWTEGKGEVEKIN